MNALEIFRQQHAVTFREMARQAGVSPIAIFKACKGRSKVSAEYALKYRDAFGIPLHDLRPDLWPPEPEPEPEEAANHDDRMDEEHL